MTDTKEDILSAAEEKKYIQHLAILRTKMRSSLLKPQEAMTNLKELATKRRTSTAVLVGIIIVAENVTVSQKPADNTPDKQPVTNPALVPDAAQVIENAVKNPKSDEVVAEAADSAVSSIKDNAAPSQLDEINKHLENIEKLLKDILKHTKQQQSNQSERPQQKPEERPQVRPDGVMPKYGAPRLPDPHMQMIYGIRNTKPLIGIMSDGHVVTKDKDGEWKDVIRDNLKRDKISKKDLEIAKISSVTGKFGRSNG